MSHSSQGQTKEQTKKIAKVGIALAAYKPHHRYFAKQLQSFLDQTFTNWVCVICSDSPLDEYVEQEPIKTILTDNRFTVIENPVRLGFIKNFETALREVLKQNPDAVAFSDQDDVWHVEKLAKQVARLEKLPPMSMVHTNMYELREEGTKDVLGRKTVWDIEKRNVEESDFLHLLIRNVVTGATLLMDAGLAKKYSIIPPSMNVHDHWFALAAALNGGVYPMHECLMFYRQHGGNIVGVKTPIEFNRDFIFDLSNKAQAKFNRAIAMMNAFGSDENKIKPQPKLFVAPDKGLGFLGFGLSNILSDPILTKDALGLALGKYLVGSKSKAKLS